MLSQTPASASIPTAFGAAGRTRPIQVFILGVKWCQRLAVVVAVKGLAAHEGGAGHGCDVGMLPWGLAFGLCCREPELSSSTLQLYACTVTSPFVGKMHGLISSWCYQSWYCSSAGHDTEKFTACAASACVPRGPGLPGPQRCAWGLGWIAVPTLHAFLLVCVNKCWVMAGGCLARGDTVFGETLSRVSRSTFCTSN